MEELITVCVPVYNGAKNIEESIRSIMGQTYKKIKIIVCDNASVDDTGAIVKKLMLEDSRIKYKRFEEYLDVNYNFLRALRLAKDSDIVCLYHADDWYYPDAIEREYKYITKSEIGAVLGKFHFSNDSNMRIINDCRRHYNTDYEIYDYNRYVNEALTKGTIFPCPTLMTRISVLMATGLLQAVNKMISDMNFWMNIVRKYKIVFLNFNLVNYRISEYQLSSQIFNRKRVTVSPQFILLDEELSKIKKDKTIIIDPDSIAVYEMRRNEELQEIIRNLKGIGSSAYKYDDIYNKKKELTIENIAKDEEEYLNLLYGRLQL